MFRSFRASCRSKPEIRSGLPTKLEVASLLTFLPNAVTICVYEIKAEKHNIAHVTVLRKMIHHQCPFLTKSGRKCDLDVALTDSVDSPPTKKRFSSKTKMKDDRCRSQS